MKPGSLWSGFLGIFAFLFLTANTMLGAFLLYPFAIIKLFVPFKPVIDICNRALTAIAFNWIRLNNFGLDITRDLKIVITGAENLSKNDWYLVIANHQSGVDIPILQRIFIGRIPFLKFFLKRELIWVPLLGLAWWAMNFPYMKRYSREYLEAHPEKKGIDAEKTRKMCQKCAETPTSVLNFVEGTRFTDEKHRKQSSPYKRLLKPRAGGIAYAMSALGHRFSAVLDVTLYYEGGAPSLWSFLTGNMGTVRADIRRRAIPENFSGDYSNDDQYKKDFQDWLNNIWKEKDDLMKKFYKDELESKQ